MLYTAHLALYRYLCYMESEWQTCANDLILHLFHRYICKPSLFLSGKSLCLNLLSEYLVQIVVIDIFIKFAFSTRIISIMSLINHLPPICWSIFWKTSSVWEGFLCLIWWILILICSCIYIYIYIFISTILFDILLSYWAKHYLLSYPIYEVLILFNPDSSQNFCT